MSINRCERCPHITCESDIKGRIVMLPEGEQVALPFRIEECGTRDTVVTNEEEINFLYRIYKPHLVEKLGV